eukprot:7379589-Prymnesium_polylepis.2
MARLPLVEFSVRWWPFELKPSSSGGTRTLRKVDAYLSFMGSLQQVESYFRRLRSEGEQTGIDFEFEGRTSGTYDAHRLAEYALAAYGAPTQGRLVEAQFSQYMERGEPPNSTESQLAAAAAAGMDVDAARAVLLDPHAFRQATDAKLRAAAESGISGVPAFKIDGELVATGAQSPDYWEGVLRQQIYRRLRASG